MLCVVGQIRGVSLALHGAKCGPPRHPARLEEDPDLFYKTEDRQHPHAVEQPPGSM